MERVILHGLKSKPNSRSSSSSPLPRPDSHSNNNDLLNVNKDNNVNRHNSDNVNKSESSAINQSDRQPRRSWTSANFIPNEVNESQAKTSFSIDKLVLNKRKGNIFNGERKSVDSSSVDSSANASGQNVRGTSQETNTSDTLNYTKASGNQVKRKHESGTDTASKRLFCVPNSSASPQSRTTAAMLISTANQPLQISAIPSPGEQKSK